MSWPLLAAATVLATVALAPREAWLPHSQGPATAADWARVHDGTAWLARLQTDLGRRLLPGDAIAGAIAGAGACSAGAAWLQARALQAAGLPPALAGLLAIVAVLAPFAVWQSASPLGAAPVWLASAAALWWFTRQSRRDATDVPADAGGMQRRDRRTWRAVWVLVASSALAEWFWAVGASGGGTAARTLATELGALGLMLMLPSLARRTPDRLPGRVWIGLATIGLVSLPLAAHVRVAATLPWAWWLAGAGLAELLAWRAPRSPRPAAIALAAWAALHIAAAPWGLPQQQAALIRTWAEGIAVRIDDSHVVVHDASARGALLAALARDGRAGRDSPAVVVPQDAYALASGGRHVLVTTPDAGEVLRWSGLALDTWPDDPGVPLDRLLDALPHGTVVLAAISGEAAATVTPPQWQALGRAGLRRADAGSRRARVLAGVTGARAEALEAATAGAARLDVLPGDPLGRTGVRSPADVRLDADATSARVALRGKGLPTGDAAVVVVLLNTRGDVLAWRSGPDAQHLDGPALGTAPVTRSVSVAALPCLHLSPGRRTDITPLLGLGALGVSWASAAGVEVELTRPPGTPAQSVRLAGRATPEAPRLTETSADTFVLQASDATAAGVYLRGPVSEGRASADGPVRLCAAWPMTETVDPARPTSFRMSPDEEPHHGSGWHESEFESGTGFFRWMAGPRAELLLALRTAAPLTLSLDAQAPDIPAASDVVRLSVNGRDLGARPLQPTRGLYTWAIDAGDLRPGMNRLTLWTTQARRPADRKPGADGRTLGLLVRGWALQPQLTQPRL